MGDVRQLWTPEQDARLLELRRDGQTWAAIGEFLARTEHACKNRHLYITDEAFRAKKCERNHDRKFIPRHRYRTTKDETEAPPPSLIAARDARSNAPRSLTAMFFGDPPTGYSALDETMKGNSNGI